MRADALGLAKWGIGSLVGRPGGAVVLALAAFGEQTSEELAERLGYNRVRDLEGRQLAKLESLGVVKKSGERWTLPADHRLRSEKLEAESYTTVHRRRVRQMTDEGRVVTYVEETELTANEEERRELKRADHALDRAAYAEYLAKKAERESLAKLDNAEGDEQCRDLLNEWDAERDRGASIRDVTHLRLRHLLGLAYAGCCIRTSENTPSTHSGA